MKSVFSNKSDVAHLFAHKTQETAKDGNGRIWFNGDAIYSYGRHFPIAAHFQKGKKSPVVLFTTRTQSNTTAGHIWAVRSACSHLDLLFCNDPIAAKENRHQGNLEQFDSEAQKTLEKLQKSTKPEKYLVELNQIKAKFDKYITYFDIPKKEIKKLNFVNKEVQGKADSQKLVGEYLKNREIEAKKARLKAIQNFRDFKDTRFYNPKNPNETLLRLQGDQIETSKGIKFSKGIGKRFLETLTKIKKGEKSIDGIKILDYTLQKCDEKTVLIGCHEITWKEIDKVAELI